MRTGAGLSTTTRAPGPLRLHTGEVDLGRQRLLTPDGVISLTTREAELLAYLADRSGQAVSREDLLTDVWNYRATNPTRAVDLAVKRLRAKVEPDPSEPVHILSVHGVGYRFVPLQHTPAPGPRLGDGDAASRTTNLTPERTSFVGRAAELTRLHDLFEAGARLVTVMGTAGTGKTRLARRFGSTALPAFPGGVWFCDVVEAQTLDDVLGAVTSTLDLKSVGEAGPDEVGRALADRAAKEGRLLVILDNFERVVEQATPSVGRWMDFTEDACFLVTSRERLHVRGERILELMPLPWDDALALLLERASAVRRGLSVTGDDRDVLAAVVAQLDGIPLAIELAASRLGTLSPSQLHKRLESRFKLLGDPRSDRPRRHATLGAALDWSWDLMTTQEQRALAALSVFEGGFTLEAAEEVLEEDEDDPDAPWPADLIQSLRDKSLVSMDDTSGVDMRYRLLESIREYAARRLMALGCDEGVRARHATYYLREGQQLVMGLHGSGGRERMEDLYRERHNLIAVARAAVSPDARVRAVLCLFPVLRARGPHALLDDLLEQTITSSKGQPDFDEHLLGRLLVDRGFLSFGRARITESERDFVEASSLASHYLDVRARALLGIGRVRKMQGRLDDAASAMRESIELYGRLGDRPGEGRARTLFATVLTWQDCIEEAAAEYDRALRVVRRVSDRWTEGLLYANLTSFLLEKRHAPEEAERRAAEALEILRDIGDHRAQVLLLLGFAVALTRMGRAADATPKLIEARDIAREMGDRVHEAQAVANLGWAEAELGRLDDAEQHLVEALAMHRGLGDRTREGATLRFLGAVRQEQRRWLEAETLLTEAREIFEGFGQGVELAVTNLQLGMLWLDHGRSEQALKSLADARVHVGGRFPWVETQSLGFTALVRAHEGQIDEAEDLLQQVASTVDPRDRREAALIVPLQLHLALVRARLADDRVGLPAAVADAEALVADGPTGAAESRLALRLLARELDRTHG